MSFRIAIFLSFLAFHSSSQTQEAFLDSVLLEAYMSKEKSISNEIFSEAKSLLKNEEDESSYYYFKHYYFYRNHQLDSASYYAEKAFPLLLKYELFDRLFAVKENEFWIFCGAGNSEAAISLCLEMLDLAKEQKNVTAQIRFLVALANAYHDVEFYAKGVANARLALSKARSSESIDSDFEHVALNMIAINYDDWGEADSAIAYHRLALNLKDVPAYLKEASLNNIGNSFMKINELDSAEKYITQSVRVNQTTRDSYSLSTSMNNLADVWLRKEKLDSVKVYLDSAEIFAFESKSIEKQRDVFNTIYRYYQYIGNESEAIIYLKKFHTAKDSMVNSKKLQVIENIEKQALQKEKDVAILNRNLWIAILIIGTLLLLFLLRQAYIKRKQTAKETQISLQNERLRISRDLHDNLGAELSYMKSIIDQKLYLVEDEESKKELLVLGESSKNAMNQLRETIWAVQTEEITLIKFSDKLRQLSQKYTQYANIDLEVIHHGEDVRLEPSQVINMFRVCQEAINNAIKHADCSEIGIKINGDSREVKIELMDNGVGFDFENVNRGYGLNNMSQRIEELNGKIKIESGPAKGTTILIVVPLAVSK